MVIRILLTIALISTVWLGAAYYHLAGTNKILRKDLTTNRELVSAQAQTLKESQDENQQLRADLKSMDVDLGQTKTRITAAESAKIQLGRELRSTRETVTASEAKITELTQAIVGLQTELDESNSRQTSPASVAAYQSKIERLEQALAEANSKVSPAPSAQDESPPPGYLLTTSRARTSLVMSVGPASAFVIVNYGAVHGALPAQLITIRRGTETVATALITDVREKFSIAQVQPESLRGALHKGDSAVIAN
jgi:peptidoglycan hydrolase CwlO-like protein